MEHTQSVQTLNKIRRIISSYKANFETINPQERYKWEAIGWYKKHWNIESPHFAQMIADSFGKAGNLLVSGMYYPYKMLTEYAQADPEAVRALFRMLHNEDIPLAERYVQFRKGFEKRMEQLSAKEGKTLQHYQDLRAVMVYLTFEYPEKYFLFKSRMYSSFRNRVGYTEKKQKQKSVVWKIESYNRLCELILKEIQEDTELIRMSRDRLDDTCYPDESLHLLTMDIVYYGGVYLKEKDYQESMLAEATSVYWPSLEEYNPGLSKDDWKRFLTEIEMPGHPVPMQMLRALMDQDGEATCKRLADVYGGHPSRYVGASVNLGKRAEKYFHLPVYMDGDKKRYFPIPFLGRYTEEKGEENYSYRIRPELVAALKELDLTDFKLYVQDEEDLEESMTDVGLNTILYGPPGTGKTYHTVIYAVAIIENKELAQVEKEDYDAVLKRYHEYKAQGRIEFTTFHQSYGYEEFIEGIRPAVMDEGDQAESGQIQYRVQPGIFKKFCERAEQHCPIVQDKASRRENYVFIIDEINRGNISKIFGELITLIEEPKRVGKPEEVTAILPYSQKSFGVPKNVYLIGTMNTADRSIAAIDTALRRRFQFREMMPDAQVLAGISVEDLSVSDMLDRMNRRIAVLYDREHTIGHSYFLPLREEPTVEKLAEIFTNNIIPLLQEYFYEDYEKIRLVLGDNQKDSDEYRFIIARENDYADLFGYAELDMDGSVSYEINYNAFGEIEAYRSI